MSSGLLWRFQGRTPEAVWGWVNGINGFFSGLRKRRFGCGEEHLHTAIPYAYVYVVYVVWGGRTECMHERERH